MDESGNHAADRGDYCKHSESRYENILSEPWESEIGIRLAVLRGG